MATIYESVTINLSAEELWAKVADVGSMQVVDEGNGKSTFIWIADVKPDSMADELEPLYKSELDGLGERLGA